MRRHPKNHALRLKAHRKYREREVELNHCPYCQNERIGKSPRRKGGPTMFHCKRCGYMATLDQMNDMHRLLGHIAA